MTGNGRYGYLYIACLQLIICFLVFPRFFTEPSEALFCTYGDGIKNYFTLESFVREPIGPGGIFKYNTFSYPFGDYVYYTDNTPLFALSLRWFCHHVTDISAYTLPLFNIFIISNILCCSLLVYWVFRNSGANNIIGFLLALMLPWTTAQLQRVWVGHFNLSLSVLPVAALALFLLWNRHRQHLPRLLLIALGITCFALAAFLLHGYYMAIITIFVAALLFFHSLYTRREAYGRQRILISLAIPLLTLGLILLLLQYTDPYLPLRKEAAMGYDYGEQKTVYAQLFTHYYHQRIYFPLFSSKEATTVELQSYLGNIGLFTLLVLFAGALFSKRFRRSFSGIQRSFFADPVRKTIFFSGLLLLIISFGERYTTNKAIYRLRLPVDLSASFYWLEYLVYGGLLLFIGYQLVQLRKNRQPFPEAQPKVRIKERILVFLAAFALVYIMVAQYTVTYTNILNPFWYLHFFTRRVEQFRSIARFNWPFFWTFYLWVCFILVWWYRHSGKTLRRILVAAVLLLGIAECTDNALYLRHKTTRPNIFSAASLRPFDSLKLRYSDYQAILPLPYFNVGSEDYDHTINDEDDFSSYVMQLILHARLPTMACKLSRTPPVFSVQLMDLLANDRMHPDLKRLLNHKPILVVADRNLLSDTNAHFIPDQGQPVARELCLKIYTFIQRHQLKPIDSSGNKLFYSWQVM